MKTEAQIFICDCFEVFNSYFDGHQQDWEGLEKHPLLQPATYTLGFPGGSEGKESDCNAGNLCSIPGSGRSLREGHGNPLQHFCMDSCMENPIEEPGELQSMGLQRVRHV